MAGEMVERVARAIAAESGVSDWEHVSEDGEYDSRAYWRRLARANLTAARDPTDAMLTAWIMCDDGGDWRSEATREWQAMIDAALE